jgi:hypothetical protein
MLAARSPTEVMALLYSNFQIRNLNCPRIMKYFQFLEMYNSIRLFKKRKGSVSKDFRAPS